MRETRVMKNNHLHIKFIITDKIKSHKHGIEKIKYGFFIRADGLEEEFQRWRQ